MLKYGNKTPMRIRLTAASNIAARVNLKAITRSGILNMNVITTADGKLSAGVTGIDDFPIMISASDPTDAFLPNQCWVNISLELNKDEHISLASGFVYIDKGVTWPNASLVDAVPGRGFITEVASANPAANAELTLTVPDGELWQVKAISTHFTADANVADRVPHFVFTGPGGLLIHTWAAAVFAASEAAFISCAKWGLISGVSNMDDFRIEMPSDIWLPPASTITSVTQNLQAGDDYTAMVVLVEKFFGQA